MTSKGYFRIPRSLTRSSLWIDMPPAYRDVFYTILDHACYNPYEFDDHGKLITLQPGQFCASIREITRLCGRYGDKNVVERAIAKFEKHGLVRKEVRHTKMLITITQLDTYELINKTSETACETACETQSKNNNKNNKEYNTPPNPQMGIEETKESERVGVCEKSFSLEKTKSLRETKPPKATIKEDPIEITETQKISPLKQKYGDEQVVELTYDQQKKLMKIFTPEEFDYWVSQIETEIMRRGISEFNKRNQSHYHAIIAYRDYRKSKLAVPTHIQSKFSPRNENEEENKRYARSAERSLQSKDYRLEVCNNHIEILHKYSGTGLPQILEYKDFGFKEKLQSHLMSRGFKIA